MILGLNENQRQVTQNIILAMQHRTSVISFRYDGGIEAAG